MEEKKGINAGTIRNTLAIALSILNIINFFLVLPSHVIRGFHLAFVFAIAYLKFISDTNKTIVKVFDLGKMVFLVFACLFYTLNYDSLMERVTSITIYDQLIGAIFIILIVEITSRIIGKGMSIITGILLLYALIGQYIPAPFGHAGYSIPRVIGHLYLSSNGVFGSLIVISATYIAMFTLLGSFLENCGASDTFIKLALKVAGKLQGGPALAAVIASCLFGMVNGSGVVNVITTGTLTIPLMKSIGIEPFVAGAVEAAASTGGQIMPPIMGSGAFVMADVTGVPYSGIIVKAFIPALLYFGGVFMAVFLYVKRENIKPLNNDQIPKWKDITKQLYLILPLFLVAALILMNFSPSFSAIGGIIFCALLIVIQFKISSKAADKIKLSLIDGAENLVSIAIGLACAGLIIGVITLTGLGAKFVSLVVSISQGIPLLALFLVAVACIILGMGLPTTAAYVITSALAAPALVKMNLPLVASHLFVFYFAVIAPITPPVAVTAYAGAGIANADPNKTGWKAFVFALPGFITPFIFVFNPVLLCEGDILSIIVAVFTALLGTFVLASSTQGYFINRVPSIVERIILFCVAFLLLKPGYITDMIGLIIVGILAIRTIYKNKKVEKVCDL